MYRHALDWTFDSFHMNTDPCGTGLPFLTEENGELLKHKLIQNSLFKDPRTSEESPLSLAIEISDFCSCSCSSPSLNLLTVQKLEINELQVFPP